MAMIISVTDVMKNNKIDFNFMSLTIRPIHRLVKGMKLNDKHIKALVKSVFDELKSQQQVTFKVSEEKVFLRAVELVHQEFEKEKQLDEEVHRMMDDLERQNPDSFQRYKMFPMLKKRLAKEKGIVL